MQNIPPKIVYIVLLDGVANGSNLEIYIRRTGGNMESAVGVRQKSAVFVMASGMAQRIARRTRRQIGSLKQPSRQVGNDATIAGLWWS